MYFDICPVSYLDFVGNCNLPMCQKWWVETTSPVISSLFFPVKFQVLHPPVDGPKKVLDFPHEMMVSGNGSTDKNPVYHVFDAENYDITLWNHQNVWDTPVLDKAIP